MIFQIPTIYWATNLERRRGGASDRVHEVSDIEAISS